MVLNPFGFGYGQPHYAAVVPLCFAGKGGCLRAQMLLNVPNKQASRCCIHVDGASCLLRFVLHLKAPDGQQNQFR